MYRGQFATRHTFAKKKGQQPCGSVKWKKPARTDMHASARLHVGKGFLKAVDGIAKKYPKCSSMYIDGCSFNCNDSESCSRVTLTEFL